MNNHDGTSLPHQRLPIFSSVHQPRPLLDGQKKSISNKKKNRSTCSLPTLLWFMIVVVGIVVCFSFFHFTHDHPTEIISKWFHTSLSVPYDQSDSKLPPQHELETHSHNKNNKNQVKNDEKVNKSAASTKGENVKNLNLSMMENLDGAHLELRNDKTKESLLHLKKAQQKVIRNVVQQLQSHPLHRFHTNNTNHGIEDYLLFLSRQSECKDIPIFVSMANVFSELYWQMIENFIYTMTKFNLSSCAAMVCVSDDGCMSRCRASQFPCIDFQFKNFHPNVPLPSALEQIAELKLYHIPKALDKGVDLIMIDLDVGFLDSPMNIVRMIDKSVDVYVQKDITYVMNRSLEGWKTWYTEPLTNIGVFFVRGNKKTVKLFDSAWKDYLSIDKPIKHNPGKDQNKVAQAIREARYSWGLQSKYFPADQIVLLDMVYKFHDPRYEFGGEAAVSVLNPAMSTYDDRLFRRHYTPVRKMVGSRTQDVGQVHKEGGIQIVHTTCYEQKVKVNGLKTVNAYWNPYYYDPTRRTITKPLIYITASQFTREVRTLMYLAYVTKRSVIIPNVLGPNNLEDYTEYYRDQAMWPWFRVPFFMKHFEYDDLQIIEPAYYWRIERDYFQSPEDRALIPKPFLVNITDEEDGKGFDGHGIDFRRLEQLLHNDYKHEPRIVLNVHFSFNQIEKYISTYNWAQDSVGGYRDYETEVTDYAALPNLQPYRQVSSPNIAGHFVQHTRICKNTFEFNRGNRSCFDKCD